MRTLIAIDVTGGTQQHTLEGEEEVYLNISASAGAPSMLGARIHYNGTPVFVLLSGLPTVSLLLKTNTEKGDTISIEAEAGVRVAGAIAIFTK